MSDRFELLVIGGGPAGFSAVRAFRESDGLGPVAIVCDEQRMPYRRPPLTKELLRGETTEESLPLEAETWLADNEVQLISGRAVRLDLGRREVTLSGGRELSYSSCVLATGSEPTRLPGSDDPAVRVLRSLDDLRELEHRLDAGSDVVVIGSGFIGCEIAASLRRRKHAVTLFSDEDGPNAGRLGSQAAAELASWLTAEGVTLHLGAAVDSIRRRGVELEVSAGQARAGAPVIVMATGVVPRGELAAAAGLSLDGGAVPVDDAMRTAAPDLLAVGDVCKALNAAAGRALRVEHWGDALAQGEIAGRVAAGKSARWDEVPGFWSTIGARTLKYAAWGDGHDQCRFERHGDGAFTAWYGRDDRIVGVLAHQADESYERGRSLIARGARWDS
jgi:3-phenylpropionate/trans-cinnamate dioxygenase ferredoxin reductase component